MRAERLRIGTRGSDLALWQANLVAERLREAWPGLEVQVRPVKTAGDRILDKPLSEIGDTGLFTSEIERALASGEVDLCVHSMKDVPTVLPDGFELSAMLERGDARDALVCPSGADLRDLPEGARIGTGSLRRAAQLLALRPDLKPASVRGNVPTRIGKALDGSFDAVVLAAAGIERLGLQDCITEYFEPEVMIPAAGQGAIGVETRRGDDRTARYLQPVADPDTMRDVGAERLVMRALGGGCQVPVGVYARMKGGSYRMDAFVGSRDGARMARTTVTGRPCDARGMVLQAVRALRDQGADAILGESR